MQFFAFFCFLAAVGVSAVDIPRAVELEPRFPYASGGWGLMISSEACPAGTTESDPCGGFQDCCPNQMTVPSGTLACCVENTNCATALESIPFCADSTWSLWNSTINNFFFCCLGDQVGLQDGLCVSDITEVAASISAVSLGHPTPVGAAGGTFSASATAGATNVMTSLTLTRSPTTTATTLTGTTSAVHTHNAMSLTPLSLNLFGSGLLRWGTVLEGAFGFGFMLLHA